MMEVGESLEDNIETRIQPRATDLTGVNSFSVIKCNQSKMNNQTFYAVKKPYFTFLTLLPTKNLKPNPNPTMYL